jgi:hypothetical protein
MDPIEIFFSYAHKDKELMEAVRKQLVVYERNGRIKKWQGRLITPGKDWSGQISSNLIQSKIVLLFMSHEFIESRYCYEVEGQLALEGHRNGKKRVVPIIARPCPWEDTPFGAFQALPTGGKPISTWNDLDNACLDTAKGVMKAVDEIVDVKSAAKAFPVQVNSPHQIIYCIRCGNAAGDTRVCTGSYIHHELIKGNSLDYCSRCGIRPRNQSTCTGSHTHHDFSKNVRGSVFCSRCGAEAGKQTTCTGSYTYHSFETY